MLRLLPVKQGLPSRTHRTHITTDVPPSPASPSGLCPTKCQRGACVIWSLDGAQSFRHGRSMTDEQTTTIIRRQRPPDRGMSEIFVSHSRVSLHSLPLLTSYCKNESRFPVITTELPNGAFSLHDNQT
ncbi:hypothetical protein FHG87_003724 [Trinorchestia longiramus]|nr:hypothetical protein FHG87_003724 [Trinorchestia longiramus]